jgi:hypothetical protein
MNPDSDFSVVINNFPSLNNKKTNEMPPIRKFLAVTLILCVTLVASGCEFSDVVVATIINKGQQAAAKVAQAPSVTAAWRATNKPNTIPSATLTSPPTLTPTPLPTPRLVYADSDGTWIVDPPKPPVRIADMKEYGIILLSDDGNRIAYLTGIHGNPEPIGFHVMNPDGGDDRTLLAESENGSLEKPYGSGSTIMPASSVQWIPGTNRLIFFTANNSARMDENNPRDDLFETETDSGALTRVFAAGKGGYAFPSPDG